MKRVLKPTGSTFKRQKIMARDKSPSFRKFPSQKGGILSVSKFQPHGQQELKWTDTTPTIPASATATNSFVLLNGLTQGTTQNTRIGSRVYMKSLLVRFNFTCTPTAGSFQNPIRVMVIYDKEANGAAPAATNVLTADTLTAPMNLNFPGRFLILFDEYVHVENNSIGTSSYLFERYIKIGLPVLYGSGNAGTVADITSGAVWCMVNTGGMSYTSGATISYARIRYEDN